MKSLTDLEITGLTADSRAVKPGFLFAALPGSLTDGRTYIGEAMDRGAVAVLAPLGTSIRDPNVKLITDLNPRQRFAKLAASYFDAQPETAVAVTGTNGKTSVATFLQQIWSFAGYKAAALGTLGVTSDVVYSKINLTTPDPESLHKILSDLHRKDVKYVALEASSHGLDQYRLDGVKVSAAAFTNLSRDHLDYHGSMAAYLAAKLRLFDELLEQNGTAVINADAPESGIIADAVKKNSADILTYGFAGKTLHLKSIETKTEFQTLNLDISGVPQKINLPLVGKFQAMNVLCAAGLALATGVESEQVIKAIEELKSIPGRLEYVGKSASGASVFVDYAHTPHALATALEALRHHTDRRLIVVFGAGGNRDAGKRPLMGQSAQAADIIYVTDDNPRTEDSKAIRQAILRGCPDAKEISDRETAISVAIQSLAPGDILLIAGKGHESGQIIGTVSHTFDDRAVARAAIKESGSAS